MMEIPTTAPSNSVDTVKPSLEARAIALTELGAALGRDGQRVLLIKAAVVAFAQLGDPLPSQGLVVERGASIGRLTARQPGVVRSPGQAFTPRC
jgi:hypothetical protein